MFGVDFFGRLIANGFTTSCESAVRLRLSHCFLVVPFPAVEVDGICIVSVCANRLASARRHNVLLWYTSSLAAFQQVGHRFTQLGFPQHGVLP